jgi:hypothetical protein
MVVVVLAVVVVLPVAVVLIATRVFALIVTATIIARLPQGGHLAHSGLVTYEEIAVRSERKRARVDESCLRS